MLVMYAIPSFLFRVASWLVDHRFCLINERFSLVSWLADGRVRIFRAAIVRQGTVVCQALSWSNHWSACCLPTIQVSIYITFYVHFVMALLAYLVCDGPHSIFVFQISW